MIDVRKDRWPQVRRYFVLLKASIGIVCGSIMVIAAFVGVIRGYSVQLTKLWFLPYVLLFWAFSYFPQKESFIQGLKDSIKPSLENLFYAVYFVYVSIGFLQIWHYEKGFKFYYQGEYDKAAAEYEKETQLWYLKLSSNTWEPDAMQELAKSYCQLEEYDKAVGVYELIISRYPGFYRESASFYLQRLKNGLRLIDQWRGKEQESDYDQLYDMARVYENDMNSYKRAIAVYRRITAMDIPAEDKRDAYDAILRLTPKKNNND